MVEILLGDGRIVAADPNSFTSIGELADQIAARHEIPGRAFTLKVDGGIMRRDAPAGGIPNYGPNELIETAEAAEPPEPQPTEPPDEPDQPRRRR